MTEAEALQYCFDKGFDWGGLYNLFPRVSCWCCPLQRMGAIRILYHNFPELWEQLREWQARMDKTEHTKFFRGGKTIWELEERFKLEDSQIKWDL